MKGFILSFAFAVAVAVLMRGELPVYRVMAAAPTQIATQLTAGPELEIATDTLAIIRWTSTNPGGTDLHFGIVRYGTSPRNLDQIAKSPNRRNPSHPEMIFRVRITGLQSNTRYYYTVTSEGAKGMNDGATSSVNFFATH
jgi:hypothetical protein